MDIIDCPTCSSSVLHRKPVSQLSIAGVAERSRKKGEFGGQCPGKMEQMEEGIHAARWGRNMAETKPLVEAAREQICISEFLRDSHNSILI